MALIRPGGLTGAISGSVGGVTFVAGRGAPIARHRPIRPRPADSTLEAQGILLWASRAWAELEETERAQYRTQALSFGRRNRVGVVAPISGYQLFVRRQTAWRAWGLSGLAPFAWETFEPIRFELTVAPDAFTNNRLSVLPDLEVVPLGFQRLEGARWLSSRRPGSIAKGLRWFHTVDGSALETYDLDALFPPAFGTPIDGEWCTIRAWWWLGSTEPAGLPVLAGQVNWQWVA